MLSKQPSSFRCVVCENENIHKVSGIVNAGVSASVGNADTTGGIIGSFGGGIMGASTTNSSVTVSHLAHLLQFEAPPRGCMTSSFRWNRLLQGYKVHWDNLWYCSRCDNVFNALTGGYAPPQSVKQLYHLVSPVQQPSYLSQSTQPNLLSKRSLKALWYIFLGFIVLGTLGGAAHGEITGFWLLALCGLPTLWLFKGLEIRVKAIVTGVFGFIFVCSAIYSITPQGKAANASFNNQEAHDAQLAAQKKQQKEAEKAKRQAQKDKDEAQNKALEAKEQAKRNAEQAKQDQKVQDAPNTSILETPKAEQEIKRLMKDRFGDSLRYVNVNSREDGGYSVIVGFNIGNILSNGLAKVSIEDDMKQAYKDLYTADVDVHYASISAYGTTQDKFGHESESIIYETNMMRDIGRQINWDNYSSLDFNNLWTVEIMNPSFQQ